MNTEWHQSLCVQVRTINTNLYQALLNALSALLLSYKSLPILSYLVLASRSKHNTPEVQPSTRQHYVTVDISYNKKAFEPLPTVQI
jgi:hypothetical protein